MAYMKMSRSPVAFFAGFIVFFVLIGGNIDKAHAAVPPEFDAVLSLTGGCTVSAADPVPDPGCPGGEHPPAPFNSPRSIATDSYGDIYIASYGPDVNNGSEGRIDIFAPTGEFISELSDPVGPKSLAIDSNGNLYVYEFQAATLETPSVQRTVRYTPSMYNPLAGEIAYAASPDVVAKEGNSITGITINPANDHLFVHYAEWITEYSSAAEGNKPLEKIAEKDLSNFGGVGIAVDAAHNRLYASDFHAVKIFELDAPHLLLGTIEGSTDGSFANSLAVAVDEGTGDFFVFDGEGTNSIYEFTKEGALTSTIKHNIQYVFGAEITVDNGKNSPNGALNARGRYLYVPSNPSGIGHSFAFGPPEPKAPEVELLTFSGVTETEAELEATIKPEFLETTYRIEYTSKEAFEAEGFAGATLAKEGTLPAGVSLVKVATALEGLKPGATYVFRVFAENAKGPDEAEKEFATFPATEASPSCPNQAFRIGPSELLPDCRAYELVTPPDTNARTPLGIGHLGTYFATRGASPDGNAATFEIEGGAILGYEGTGSYAGDPYVVHRNAGGWATEYAGPTPTESPELLPGSNSPDQGYSFWSTAGGKGSAAVEEQATSYVRYPDGHSALVGRGSLGIDPRAVGELITEQGGHIVFSTKNLGGDKAIQLEENAPPEGTVAIYDRTAEEVTRVVSLLPDNKTPAAGQDASYRGSSLDGKGIAFEIGSTLYLRYENNETYEVAKEAIFAGVAEGGKRIFYVKGGDLFAFDVELEEAEEGPIQFSSSGNVTPVNVAPNGNVAYFVSSSVLVGSEEPNPEGDLPIAGQSNLYRSEEGSLSFVGMVTKRDVDGENNGVEQVDGLGLWIEAVRAPGISGTAGRFGKDPSRTTPDGSVLLFSSRAVLTDYNSADHPEIYRFDAAAGSLDCLSCNPTLAPATGDASLQSVSREQGAPEPGSSFTLMNNLRSDGRRVFFQSSEQLALDDTDSLQDIYEWEAEGVGSCKEAGGCVYLISSGHSRSIDYLWAVSDSGDDVFFRSGDLLTGSDKDETPSIYDARVEGGFAEPVKREPCQGEGCGLEQPTPPSLPAPGTPPTRRPGNVSPSHPCPKGKHKATRNGKTVCVKKKHHKKHHRRAGSKRKGASK